MKEIEIIGKLFVGQIIKNYKELCSILGVKVASGNTKIAHIKELDRYCKYHKQKQKFIIDEVFEKPRDKIDRRAKGNNNKYGTLLDDILVNALESDCLIEVSRTQLLKDYLHIFSDTYYNMCLNQTEYIEKYNLHKFITQKYLNTAYSVVTECIKTTLKRLSKQGIIECSEKTLIKDNPGDFYADDDDLKVIKEISDNIYKDEEIGITPYSRSIPEVNKKFKKMVCDSYNEKTKKQIFNFWKLYEIRLMDDVQPKTTNLKSLRLRLVETINTKIKSIEYVDKKSGNVFYPYQVNKFSETFQQLNKLVFEIEPFECLEANLEIEEKVLLPF